jgi:hypothetical protein
MVSPDVVYVVGTLIVHNFDCMFGCQKDCEVQHLFVLRFMLQDR